MEELASVLVAESRALAELVYRLETLQHFLALDEVGFVERAADEAAAAAGALRDVEGRRADVVRTLARSRGVDPSELTLRRLAGEEDNPFASMLVELHRVFLELTSRLERLRRAIAETVGSRRRDVARIFEALGAGHGGATGAAYGPAGDPVLAGSGHVRDLGRL